MYQIKVKTGQGNDYWKDSKAATLEAARKEAQKEYGWIGGSVLQVGIKGVVVSQKINGPKQAWS